MKKFHFQLDTVLGYKQQVLDTRLIEHGVAMAQVTRQEGVVADVTSRLTAYEDEYRQKKSEGLTIMEVMKYQNCLQALGRESRIESEKLERFRQIEEEKRNRVIETRKETASLEKLREIKQQEYDKDVQKAEERFIDDLTAAKLVASNARAFS